MVVSLYYAMGLDHFKIGEFMKEIDASLTISRPMFGDGRKEIRIKVRDEKSRNDFVELHISYEDFAAVVTGLSEVKCRGTVKGLENVGKEKVIEERKVEYPGSRHKSREELEQWLLEECQEEGWNVNAYLGSQSSLSYNGDKLILKYLVYKFV